MKPEVERFWKDDPSYLRWIWANPSGWVLNVPRAARGTVVQHQSGCAMIRGARAGSWTGGNYYKIVGTAREALQAWLSSNWSQPVRLCRHCLQAENATATARPQTSVLTRPETLSLHSVVVSPVSTRWQLWSLGKPVEVLRQIEPRLASWDHRGHASQLRLNEYLMPVKDRLVPLLAKGGEWAISMIVDVAEMNG